MFNKAVNSALLLKDRWRRRARLFNHLNRKLALRTDCYLVKGVKGGAIYNLNSGKVYSVGDTSVRILGLALARKDTFRDDQSYTYCRNP